MPPQASAVARRGNGFCRKYPTRKDCCKVRHATMPFQDMTEQRQRPSLMQRKVLGSHSIAGPLARQPAWRASRRRSRGQALVEFALVFPIVLILIVFIVEFAFLFNALLSINFASRNAALIGAEAGDQACADALILQKVEQDVGAPADSASISSVEVMWVDTIGNVQNGGAAINKYKPGGSISCTPTGGAKVTVPYTLFGAEGYPIADRCQVILGTGCKPGHSGLDVISVRITYDYRWHTPLPGLIPFLKNGPGPTNSSFTLVQSNDMRMEPVL